MSGYRRLTESELTLLGDDELVARIAAAREADDPAGAKLAAAHLAYGFEQLIKGRVACKVPLEDLDDVAQEALVSVVSASFEGKVLGEFRSFLLTVVDRRVADYHRERGRRPGQTTLPTGVDEEDGAWGDEPAVEDASAAVEINDAVARVLATRNPHHVLMIELYGPEVIGGSDLGAAEVAARVERGLDAPRVSVANVQQVWRRFKVDLASELTSGEAGTESTDV